MRIQQQNFQRHGSEQCQWNNGLNECQNVILNDVILKTMEDTDYNSELAIAWSLNSKKYFS